MDTSRTTSLIVKLSLLGFVISVCEASIAFPRPCANAAYKSPANDLLQLTTIHGKDDRVEIQDYAKQKETTVAALNRNFPTRRFYCGRSISQANFVNKSRDVILVSAHAIYDENCNLRSDVADCFVHDVDGAKYKIDTSALISGIEIYKLKSPNCRLSRKVFGDGTDPFFEGHDWAAIRIKESAGRLPDLKPYKLAKPSPKGDLGAEYLMVTSAAKNARNPGVPSFQEFSWRDVSFGPNGFYSMKNDADTGAVMSGAAVLDRKNRLVAFHNNSTNSVEGEEYNSASNFAVAIPVSDDMISAVKVLSQPGQVISQGQPPIVIVPANGN